MKDTYTQTQIQQAAFILALWSSFQSLCGLLVKRNVISKDDCLGIYEVAGNIVPENALSDNSEIGFQISELAQSVLATHVRKLEAENMLLPYEESEDKIH